MTKQLWPAPSPELLGLLRQQQADAAEFRKLYLCEFVAPAEQPHERDPRRAEMDAKIDRKFARENPGFRGPK